MKKVIELAGILYDNIEAISKWDNGNQSARLILSNNAPEWAKRAVRKAHGDMMPDDTRYEFANEAAGLIADADEDSSEDDLREIGHSLESDIYNGELLKWISSSLYRAEYVNDAVNGGLVDTQSFDLYAALGAGQVEEKREAFELLLGALIEIAKEMEEEDEEEA